MTDQLLLEQIKTAMQTMDQYALEHFKKLMPDFLQCFTDKEVSATLVIKEAKEDYGDVHAINANEFEMNDMLFDLCELLGLLDFQKAQLPVYLN
jgi:hypothetical protein